MKILAIETSGSTFSLALTENGVLVSEVFWQSGLKHSEKLIPALERIIKEAGWEPSMIEKIAVSTGPGSFTGIRVGLSCARAFAQSRGVPVVGIDTLTILAAGFPDCGMQVCPIIDALRDEVYVRARGHSMRIIPVLALKKELRVPSGNIVFVGNAVEKYRKELRAAYGKKAVYASAYQNVPRAGVLALAAEDIDGNSFDKITPLYIRRSWAEESR